MTFRLADLDSLQRGSVLITAIVDGGEGCGVGRRTSVTAGWHSGYPPLATGSDGTLNAGRGREPGRGDIGITMNGC
ncbi:hypothetical protein [Micromonospora violae]|uniref:hypothetical protein n=1 Tax=Micromonospora violae TaxID=1278207 RepID=UPI003408BBF0